MIYDLLGHLAPVRAESEIKYLSIIPLNGDPFLFIPGLLALIFNAILFQENVNLGVIEHWLTLNQCTFNEDSYRL